MINVYFNGESQISHEVSMVKKMLTNASNVDYNMTLFYVSYNLETFQWWQEYVIKSAWENRDF